MKRINGVSPSEIRGAVPMVKIGEKGKAVPLPPLDQLHGLDMPGGVLHRTATVHDAGFMSAEQVKLLLQLASELASRPKMEPSEFAKADHEHPKVVPEHRHSDIVEQLAKLMVFAQDLHGRVEVVANRPIVDPSAFARIGHDHPPKPLQKHEHPELKDLVLKLEAEVRSEREARLEAEAMVAQLEKSIAKLSKDIDFVRDLAERAAEAKNRTSEHGHQGGGRHHEAVNDRLAGFMTPEHLRKLEMLWDKAK
jgi:hypothetical protein